jgi:hypothetical protein
MVQPSRGCPGHALLLPPGPKRLQPGVCQGHRCHHTLPEAGVPTRTPTSLYTVIVVLISWLYGVLWNRNSSFWRASCFQRSRTLLKWCSRQEVGKLEPMASSSQSAAVVQPEWLLHFSMATLHMFTWGPVGMVHFWPFKKKLEGLEVCGSSSRGPA